MTKNKSKWNKLFSHLSQTEEHITICVLLIRRVITDVQVLYKPFPLAQALTASLLSTQGLKDTEVITLSSDPSLAVWRILHARIPPSP